MLSFLFSAKFEFLEEDLPLGSSFISVTGVFPVDTLELSDGLLLSSAVKEVMLGFVEEGFCPPKLISLFCHKLFC